MDSFFGEATILIVDDNNINLKVLGAQLRKSGYNIVVARDGESTLKIVPELMPDLILLDIMMPGMDGYEVCTILKSQEETRHIPIIFISAKVDTSDIVTGFNVGAVDYITKPFKKEELLVRVRTHLELKFSKDTIRKQAQRLEELNAAKDKLFSIVAHDVRGPLGNLKFMIQLMELKGINFGSDDFYHNLDRIKSSTDEILNLLENLLYWSRSQVGTLKCVPEEFKLEEIVRENISLLQPNADAKKISLINEVENGIELWADRNMVRTIFRNLVSNAIKFTPEKGKVVLKAKVKSTMVEISVADNGVGIPKDKISLIFSDSGYFTSYGTNREKGSGLGLQLCRSFTQMNKGKFYVESEVGKGSVFYFTIPLVSAQEKIVLEANNNVSDSDIY